MPKHARIPIALAVSILLSACATTTTTVSVQDTGRQAVLYESATAPHMKGPGLHRGELTAAIGYQGSLGPSAQGQRLPGRQTGGGAVAEHTIEGRFAVAMGGPDDPSRHAWEFGLNLALTHADMAAAQAEDFYLSSPSDVYARVGFGFRGPIVERERFMLGLGLEMDFSALPYRVEAVRRTDQYITVQGPNALGSFLEAIFTGQHRPPRQFSYGGQQFTVDNDVLTGHVFFPTVRVGMYAAYEFHERLSLSGGISMQNTPAVNGIETQVFQCEYTRIGLPNADDQRRLADRCRREKGEEFPIIHHAFAATFYAGLHVTLDDVVLTLRAQSSVVSSSQAAFASPFAGHVELAYRF